MDAATDRLDGRSALITGAGRGIGLAIARALAGVGAAVAIHDIDLDVARREAEAIASAGGRAVAVGGDLTDPDLPGNLVDATRSELGDITILVNNGSIQNHVSWIEQSAEQINRTLNANVTVPIRLCALVAPDMKRAGWGRIINLGSGQQVRGTPHMLAYSSSKAALVNVSTGVARDLAGDGVTTNLIAPGYFRTYRNPEFKDPEHVASAGRRNPMGRIGEPEDCAGVCLFLCSAGAGYINGQTIFVNGGSQ